MILNNASNKQIHHNMTMYHKVWGEVKVVNFDDKYITLSLKNNETKKLLLSSIGTHLFYSQTEINNQKKNESHNQIKKSDQFRKHYRELGLEDTLDDYNSTTADYEDVDWPMIAKPDKNANDANDDLDEMEVDNEEEDIFDHYSEEII